MYQCAMIINQEKNCDTFIKGCMKTSQNFQLEMAVRPEMAFQQELTLARNSFLTGNGYFARNNFQVRNGTESELNKSEMALWPEMAF